MNTSASNENDDDNRDRRRSKKPVWLDERLLPKRFLVVSNRLPYQLEVKEGRVVAKRGVGGLVTALDPILRLTGGLWMGWTGSYDELPERVLLEEAAGAEYHLKPINLTSEEVEQYYLGYSNRFLWPLFHYFQEHCALNRDEWESYKRVNQHFANAVVEEYQDGDLIWIHDYHLMLVPEMVRRRIPDARIGFFLHIPFPSDEIFMLAPHARELLDGVLGADVVGFHIEPYTRNFMNSVAALTQYRYARTDNKIWPHERQVRLGSYPISIDFEHFSRLASRDDTPERVEAIRNNYRADIIALGVDRLDYSKGILERLHAIEMMLDRHRDIQGKFTFVQISAPSRTKVEAYRDARERIEQMVGRINGRFGGRGCIPIDYRYESQPQEELVSYYRASDIALITPLRDGMNLVAKEYVASQVEDHGCLVLSRFAGCYLELADAVLVNPYDIEGMVEGMYQAITMQEEEKRQRMRRMRQVVRRNDIYWWLERFLRDLL